jgi:hypothetical protein
LVWLFLSNCLKLYFQNFFNLLYLWQVNYIYLHFFTLTFLTKYKNLKMMKKMEERLLLTYVNGKYIQVFQANNYIKGTFCELHFFLQNFYFSLMFCVRVKQVLNIVYISKRLNQVNIYKCFHQVRWWSLMRLEKILWNGKLSIHQKAAYK